jgi:hypothetical protein
MGGDDISLTRQGEADQTINLMNEFELMSLLPRGTKTWSSGDFETTVDLVLASADLASSTVKCMIHGTEHGSDHRAIETDFDVSVPAPQAQNRLLLKNVTWKEINFRVAAALESTPEEGTIQQKTDRLMAVVLEAVRALTPKAKPSPYAKRWWTSDLTQLRPLNTARSLPGEILTQLFKRSVISTISAPSRMCSGAIVCFVPEKTRSGSADIGGIEKIVIASHLARIRID